MYSFKHFKKGVFYYLFQKEYLTTFFRRNILLHFQKEYFTTFSKRSILLPFPKGVFYYPFQKEYFTTFSKRSILLPQSKGVFYYLFQKEYFTTFFKNSILLPFSKIVFYYYYFQNSNFFATNFIKMCTKTQTEDNFMEIMDLNCYFEKGTILQLFKKVVTIQCCLLWDMFMEIVILVNRIKFH